MVAWAGKASWIARASAGTSTSGRTRPATLAYEQAVISTVGLLSVGGRTSWREWIEDESERLERYEGCEQFKQRDSQREKSGLEPRLDGCRMRGGSAGGPPSLSDASSSS